ncbi:MAG: cupin domain-containing protein [Acidobacteriota bacterium]|nr:cupin domain-containing protein [Acidobacteriota bacterium]
MHKNKFHAVKYFGVAVICAGLCVARAQGQETDKKAAPKKSSAATAKMAEPFIGTPDKIKWVQYSPGVEFGPVHGNCDQAGAPCVFQLRFADGGKFPPHWHPVDEHVTVLSGTFMAGMGDSYDESKMVTLPAGSYVMMPKRMHHFAGAKGGTALVQVSGVGPFKINYVNAADDPKKAAKAGD